MLRRLAVRRLVDRMPAAFDRGDIAEVRRLHAEVTSLSDGANAKPTHIAWAEFFFARALLEQDEIPLSDLPLVRDALDKAEAAANRSDQTFRRLIRLQLTALRLELAFMLDEQDDVTQQVELLRKEWQEASRSPEIQLGMRFATAGESIMIGTLLTAGNVCLAALRIHDAAELIGYAQQEAHRVGDQKTIAISHVLAGHLLLLLGQYEESAAQMVALEALGPVSSKNPMPLRSLSLLAVTGAQTEAGLRMVNGDTDGAVAALHAAQSALTGPPEDTRMARLLALSLELDLLLDLNRETEARSVADDIPIELLEADGAGILLSPRLRLAMLDRDTNRALDLCTGHSERYATFGAGNQLAKTLPLVALVMAIGGRADEAVRVAESLSNRLKVMTSGPIPPRLRRHMHDNHRHGRDVCLSALALVRGGKGAPAAAASVMDAWRDYTLRNLLTEGDAHLTEDVQRITRELNAALHAAGGDLTGNADAQLQGRLETLRAELADALGAAYASLAAPRPTTAAPTDPASPRLTATMITEDDGPRCIVAVLTLPDGRRTLRRVILDETATTVLEHLDAGLALRRQSSVDRFHAAWDQVRHALGFALCADELADWYDSSDSPQPLRAELDGSIRNVPLAALPVGGGQLLGAVCPLEHTMMDTTATTPRSSRRVTVIAYCFDDAAAEAEVLHRQHKDGLIHLTLVTSLGDLWQRLRDQTYDVLALACHGQGAGMTYRFTDPDRHREALYVHDLLEVTVPASVYVASCFSGTGGASDITGLLATLLSRGATEIMSGTWALPNTSTTDIICNLYERLDDPTPMSKKLAQCQTQFVSANTHRSGVYWWAGLSVTTR
ncbi:CHAT domain-containing protein [Humibacillus xanthopallidus]|uniref:CHAT domain-containing protein n=1 Tax=Humibacillus xanthopallidus TaxID=412689 RepID=UPI0038506BFF